MSSIGDGSASAIRRLQDRIRELEAEVARLRGGEVDTAIPNADLIDLKAVQSSQGVLVV